MRTLLVILALVFAADRGAASDADAFLDHVRVLGSDDAEGRSPGTPGGRFAGDYIETTFRELGLEPPFEVKTVSDVGKLSVEQHHRQAFGYMRRPYVIEERAVLHAGAGGRELTDDEFNTLGLSGSGTLGRMPIVFVGYSIVIGEEMYGSYDGGPHDLSGRVALVLGHEPMNLFNRSRWSEESWSYHSAIPPKVGAALRRGAEGVIVVHPPLAESEHVDTLLTVEQTAQVSFDAPVIHADHRVIDRMLKLAGERTLTSLRREADKGTAIIDLEHLTVTLETEVEAGPADTANVAALLPGKGNLGRELVIVTAHYDHVGRGGLGSRAQEGNRRDIHPGADDNASGVAAMLLLAERLKAHHDALPDDAEARAVLFIALGAGEYSFKGAAHYLRKPIKPVPSNAVVINIDSIGRIDDAGLTIAGAGSGDGLRAHIETATADAPMPVTIDDRLGMTSDHHAFYETMRPALLVTETTRNPDHHTPGDSVDAVHADRAAQAIDIAYELVLICTRIDRPRFTEVPEAEDDESL